MTYAKVIADSITNDGSRLTTMEVEFHRFVLAEFNTHRMFSRNSASSRAIPVHRQVSRVRENPAMPLSWPAEQRGMQGGEELHPDAVEEIARYWKNDALYATREAEGFSKLGLHKSVTNRLLEPFMWHTVVVTSTDWDNFFSQRCSPLAQPEIRAAAEMMQAALGSSTPVFKAEGKWHTPYIDHEDIKAIISTLDFGPKMYHEATRLIAKVSAARCARVSYLTQHGTRDIHEDLALYDRLITADPPHWSPLEHVATPWPINKDEGFNLYYYEDSVKRKAVGQRPRIGNLLGWRSLRTEAEMVPE